MRVLVTGGTGFTGAALVRRLLVAVGHEVRALSSSFWRRVTRTGGDCG
jgi:uncharacterized protein YbjT (DUF2867 family)